LTANIRHGRKCPAVANALAYYTAVMVASEPSFVADELNVGFNLKRRNKFEEKQELSSPRTNETSTSIQTGTGRTTPSSPSLTLPAE
jgi:hypothetical protein